MPADFDLLRSYVPRLVTRRLADEPRPIEVPASEHTEGALLFVDISGFTPLTERMARRGAAGAEELGRLLNDFFGGVVDDIASHGGQVVDFAGDAVFALWLADDDLADAALRASQCALALQERIQARGDQDVPLAIKETVGAGAVSVLHVGGDGRRACVVAGDAQRQVTASERHAEPGSVVLSGEVAALLGDRVDARPEADGCARLVAVEQPVAPVPLLDVTLDRSAEPALRDYVPPAVQARVDAGQGDWLAEFRRVTSVFVNVVGLRYDDEGALARLHDVALSVQRIARRFKGYVSQFAIDDKGTVFLVAFGLPPRAHEDDATRGVRAALAIEQEIANQGLRSAIGITTGRVFCAPVGSQERRQYQLQADVVNLAARLMQAALDDVLCDAATARELDGAYETLAPIRVKGKTAPVAVFRPYDDGNATDARADTNVPLIGRERERDAIAGWVAQLAEEGRGHSVVLEGEAGIGKSRLVQELVDQAQLAGCLTLLGAASAIEEATPWFAWRSVFAQLFELDAVPPTQGARRRHVTRRLRAQPEHLELAPLLDAALLLDLPPTPTTASLSGKLRAERTRDLLVALLRGAAQDHPTVLILEDAHWMDSASWALARRVLDEIDGLLFVVASRPAAEGDGAVLTALTDEADEHVLLEAMSGDDVSALVCRRLQVDALGADVDALIRERAEGHPFFSEELAYALRDAQLIVVDEGRARLATDAEAARRQLPDTVQGVVTSRLDALSPEHQLTLKTASVIGRAFSPAAVRAAHPARPDDDALLGQLVELEELDLVRAARGDEESAFAFKHAIIRDVAYDGMLYAQRRGLHAAVARYLEEAHGDDLAPVINALAHHWREAAGDRGDDVEACARAASAAARAGESALEGGAFHEAHALLEDAVRFHHQLPEEGRDVADELEWLILLGTATFTTQGYGSARTLEAYERVWPLAREHGSDEQRFNVMFGRWIARHFTNADDAIAVGEQMLSMAEATGNDEHVLQAHHALWTTLMQQPDYGRSLQHLEAGLKLYRPQWHGRHCVLYGGHDPGACGQRALALSSWAMGFPDRAADAAARARDWSQRHAYTLATTQLASAFVARQRGDVDEADRIASDLVALAERNALPGFLPWARTFQAWAVGRRGDLDEGIERFERLVPALGYLDPGYMTMLLDLYQQARRAEPGLKLVDELFTAVEERNEHNFEPELHRLRGELRLCAAGGREAAPDAVVAEAADDFQAAAALAARQGALSFELRAALSYARLRAARGREAEADALLAPVYDRFTEGFETEDLRQARALLGRSAPGR
jgi:class 3 adenylate cyclase